MTPSGLLLRSDTGYINHIKLAKIEIAEIETLTFCWVLFFDTKTIIVIIMNNSKKLPMLIKITISVVNNFE